MVHASKIKIFPLNIFLYIAFPSSKKRRRHANIIFKWRLRGRCKARKICFWFSTHPSNSIASHFERTLNGILTIAKFKFGSDVTFWLFGFAKRGDEGGSKRVWEWQHILNRCHPCSRSKDTVNIIDDAYVTRDALVLIKSERNAYFQRFYATNWHHQDSTFK